MSFRSFKVWGLGGWHEDPEPSKLLGFKLWFGVQGITTMSLQNYCRVWGFGGWGVRV